MPILTTPSEPADVPTIARFLHFAFASPMDQALVWIERAGLDNFRILKDQGTPVASLVRFPMGEFFGGRSVRLAGIAGVAVPPEFRGRGYALRMMQLTLQEAAADGYALCGLYASTQTLYRKVGFEQSGHRFRVEMPISSLAIRERDGGIVPLGEQDMPAITECYRTFAQAHDGLMDRGEYLWRRVRVLRESEYAPFGVRNAAGGLDGYFFLHQHRRTDNGKQNLELSDLVFNTPQAGRRLLGLLSDFSTMAETLAFFGGPTHPALLLLPQQKYSITARDNHLTRVLDVRAAIEQRGFHPGVRAEVHIEISDDLIRANNGRFVVQVRDGSGNIQPGGKGSVRLTSNALASVFCGFVTPTQAAMLGWAEGSARDLEAANVFVGSTPWVVDQY